MGEKVLFEMRVSQDENGTHVEINTAPEWRAAHGPERRARHHAFFAWAGCCGADLHGETKRPVAEDLRRTLESLQQLYDDLYGSSSAEAAS